MQLCSVSKIQNRLVRLDVARTSRFVDGTVRTAALDGATEQELCDVAKCGAHVHTDGIRLEAVRRMSDEVLPGGMPANTEVRCSNCGGRVN